MEEAMTECPEWRGLSGSAPRCLHRELGLRCVRMVYGA